ncbi:hypothetical protein ACHAO1_006233 [Botrytis cinerea]
MLLTAFSLAQLIASPLFGYYTDRSSSRRTPLPLGFFSNAVATSALCIAQNAWILALSRFLQGLSALPIFVERKFNWDSTGAGLIFLAITFPIFLAPIAGRLSDVWPSRWLTASYFIISAVLTVLLVLIHRNSTDQIAGLAVLLTLYGVARVFGSSPLGADLSRAVESMEKKTPGIFGKTGASGQVFSLYTSASAAGVLAGPTWTSYAFGERGWIFFVSSLGILTATVAIPVILFSEPEKSAKGNDVEVVAAE